MIAGIAVAFIWLYRLIIGIIFLMNKKINKIAEEDVETIDSKTKSVENVNPIFDKISDWWSI